MDEQSRESGEHEELDAHRSYRVSEIRSESDGHAPEHCPKHQRRHRDRRRADQRHRLDDWPREQGRYAGQRRDDGDDVGHERRRQEASPQGTIVGGARNQKLAETPQHRVVTENEEENIKGEGVELIRKKCETNRQDEIACILHSGQR